MDQRPLFLMEIIALGFASTVAVTVVLSFAAIRYQNTNKIYYYSSVYSQQQRAPAANKIVPPSIAIRRTRGI